MRLLPGKRKKEILGSSLSPGQQPTERVSHRLDKLLVARSSGGRGLLRKTPKLSRRAKAIVIAICLIPVVGISYWVFDQKPVKVGDYVINKQDYHNSGNAIKNALEANGHDTKEAERQGREQAILLAALKTEADKRSIKYDRAEIDKVLQESFDYYGGREAYFAFMLDENKWTEEDVYRYRTIEYLKEKMEEDLIARRTYSMLFFRWDNLKLYEPSNFDTLYAEKESVLRTKYLPMFQRQASIKELEGSVDIHAGVTGTAQEDVYAKTGGVPYTLTVMEVGKTEIQKYQEGEDMRTKLESIESVGDFIGPFKSNMGTTVIARLEKSEGGKYRNWEHLRQTYQDSAGISFEPSTASRLYSSIKAKVSGLFRAPKASAAPANCMGSVHSLHYAITYIDYDTGAFLPANALAGTSFHTTGLRSSRLCDLNVYRAFGFSVSGVDRVVNGHSFHRISRNWSINTSNASVNIHLDCNGPQWTISPASAIRTFPGYTYMNSSYSTVHRTPFPWFDGVNGLTQWSIHRYRKNPPAQQFDVTPNRSINNSTGRVDFSVRNTRNGAARLRDGQGVMIDRRVWVNDVAVHAPSSRIIVNGNATWASSWTPASPLSPGDRICAQINVRPPTGTTGVTAYNQSATPRVAGSRTANCVTLPNPPTISCSPITTSPDLPAPGESFTVRGGFQYNGGSGSGTQPVKVTLYAPGISEVVFDGSVPFAGSGTVLVPASGARTIAGLGVGVHEIRFTIEAPGATLSSPECAKETTIANQPYFKVYGGDVQAGAAILETDGTCTKEPSARIIGWHNQAGANPGAGAGTQLAAFALGQIEGFASGQQRTPGEPKSLTFANTEANVYGGNWGAGNAPCAADFWSDETRSTPGGGSAAIATGNPLTLQAGDSRTIYVDGDVHIDNDILYSFSSEDIQSPSDYPSFRLVAKGNIYVRRNVTELNGLFVAGGTFYTCSTNGSSPPNQGQLREGHCDTPLTIHGAVIADTIKLNRTHGTLSDASTGERWDNALGKPAEKFIYSPLIWLTSDSSAGGSFDALRTLPPVL